MHARAHLAWLEGPSRQDDLESESDEDRELDTCQCDDNICAQADADLALKSFDKATGATKLLSAETRVGMLVWKRFVFALNTFKAIL